MQIKQLKNLKKSINETKKMWQDKNRKKEYLREKNCQGYLWQENYLGSQIRDTTKNTREDWKETGEDEKISKLKEEK